MGKRSAGKMEMSLTPLGNDALGRLITGQGQANIQDGALVEFKALRGDPGQIRTRLFTVLKSPNDSQWRRVA